MNIQPTIDYAGWSRDDASDMATYRWRVQMPSGIEWMIDIRIAQPFYSASYQDFVAWIESNVLTEFHRQMPENERHVADIAERIKLITNRYLRTLQIERTAR